MQLRWKRSDVRRLAAPPDRQLPLVCVRRRSRVAAGRAQQFTRPRGRHGRVLAKCAAGGRGHGDSQSAPTRELGIFELQAGLELECPLQDMPANFFFRTAYEYQKWDIDGLPTGGAGFGGTIGELTTNSFASAGLGGMTLHGISIGTGLTW